MCSLGIVVFSNKGNEEDYNKIINQITELTIPQSIKTIKVFTLYYGEGDPYVPIVEKEGFEFYWIKDKNALNALEPRLYNCALDHILREEIDYVIFFRDKDQILYENILVYYMWLFEKSHDPNLLGAVCPRHNLFRKADPATTLKMWYADDVHLRGTCIKVECIKEVGPFDEFLFNKMFELDFFTRMAVYCYKLTRVGKEELVMFRLTDEPMSDAMTPLAYLRKPIATWFARKWTNGGKYEKNICCKVSSEPISSLDFEKLFIPGDEMFSIFKKRASELMNDQTTREAIKISSAFNKKDIFKNKVTQSEIDFKCEEISSYNHSRLKYPELLWRANPAR